VKDHGLSDEQISTIIMEIAMVGSQAMQALLDEIEREDVRKAVQMSALETMLALALAYWYGDNPASIRKSIKEMARDLPSLARRMSTLYDRAQERK
jgi:hypothetical protein